VAYTPLQGYRVVDLTQYTAGPACTEQLAELGAEVLKIEFAPGGDPTRSLEYLKDGVSSYFVQHNRGKKSVCINLKTREGQQTY
jgi:formyl-CoA transferase